MNQDYADTIPSEWAASAATEIGADQDARVEPGMQMLSIALLAIPVVIAVLAILI